MSASPAGRGWGVPAPAARIERTSAARNRRNATARRSAATSASVPWAAPNASRISVPSPGGCCRSRRPRPGTLGRPRRVRRTAARSLSAVVARGWALAVARRSGRRGSRRCPGRRVRVRPRSSRWRARRCTPRRDRPPRRRWCRSASWAPSSGPRRTGHTRAGRPCAAPRAPRSAGAATATVAVAPVRGPAAHQAPRRSPNARRR